MEKDKATSRIVPEREKTELGEYEAFFMAVGAFRCNPGSRQFIKLMKSAIEYQDAVYPDEE